MSSSTPTKPPFARDGKPPLVVAGHQDERLEDEIVLLDRHDVEVADRADRGIERPTIEHDRLRQVHAGHDADPLAVTDEQRIVVAFAHQPAGRLDGRRAVDEHGRMGARVANPGAQDRIDAFRALPARIAFELAGNLRIEEGGEAGIAPDQGADGRPAARDSKASPRPR